MFALENRLKKIDLKMDILFLSDPEIFAILKRILGSEDLAKKHISKIEYELYDLENNGL
jgi:hypothetical protein